MGHAMLEYLDSRSRSTRSSTSFTSGMLSSRFSPAMTETLSRVRANRPRMRFALGLLSVVLAGCGGGGGTSASSASSSSTGSSASYALGIDVQLESDAMGVPFLTQNG